MEGITLEKSRKGAITVPGLIIAFILLFLVYVYLLPLSEKCKFLPNLKECGTSYAGETKEGYELAEKPKPITLIYENPGFLEAQERSAIYSLRPIEIHSSEEVEVARIFEGTELKKSLFAGMEEKGIFSIHDRAKQVKLFVYVEEAEGKLYLDINPEASYVIEGTGMHTITIPVELLSAENMVKLSVSAPILPYKTNHYRIEKIIVREIYSLTDFEIKRQLNVESDLKKLEAATLDFEANCITQEKIEVKINNDMLKRETICRETSIDVTKKIGKNNTIVFKSDGNYFVYPISISLKFKEMQNPSYYFDIGDDEAKKLKKNEVLAVLKLRFDSTGKKEIDAEINEEVLNIETSNIDYQTEISNYLKSGQNAITLVSRVPVKVELLELTLK